MLPRLMHGFARLFAVLALVAGLAGPLAPGAAPAATPTGAPPGMAHAGMGCDHDRPALPAPHGSKPARE